MLKCGRTSLSWWDGSGRRAGSAPGLQVMHRACISAGSSDDCWMFVYFFGPWQNAWKRSYASKRCDFTSGKCSGWIAPICLPRSSQIFQYRIYQCLLWEPFGRYLTESFHSPMDGFGQCTIVVAHSASITSWKVMRNLPYTMYTRWVEFHYGTSFCWSLPICFHARTFGRWLDGF